MHGKSKVRSEPKLDPMLLTWGQPAAKQSRQVRQSLSKQPVNLLDVHVNLDFTVRAILITFLSSIGFLDSEMQSGVVWA